MCLSSGYIFCVCPEGWRQQPCERQALPLPTYAYHVGRVHVSKAGVQRSWVHVALCGDAMVSTPDIYGWL